MLKIVTILAITISFTLSESLPMQSIVQIFSSTSAPNYQYPWQSGKIEDYTGSGIIIADNMVISSAHVVSNAKFIQVSKENDSKKYSAKLKFISHQADLALLEVQDKSFFDGIQALKFTNEIKQGDAITVLGYPMGGKTLSTTKGVISRIEPSRYSWSNETMLAIQVDAAINPGNSGGAAINSKGEVVGIAMQSLIKASNISYIVPSIIVNTFLLDIKDGKVDGYDNSKTSVQFLNNNTLKKYYGVQNDIGIVVTHLDKNENDLMLGDIILAIDDKSISNDGMIKTPYGYMNYNFAFHSKPVGDKMNIKLIRDKKTINLVYNLKQKYQIVYTEKNALPRYVIYGGFIFSPLTNNYLAAIDLTSSNFELFFFDNCRTKHIKEAVMMQYEVLPHDINIGYTAHGDLVKSVNGTLVVDFAHFVKLIDAVDSPYTTIEFIDEDYKKIIFDTQKVKESFKDIKEIYGLSSDRRL